MADSGAEGAGLADEVQYPWREQKETRQRHAVCRHEGY